MQLLHFAYSGLCMELKTTDQVSGMGVSDLCSEETTVVRGYHDLVSAPGVFLLVGKK